MPEDLTDSDVANTYKGLLHASGEELPTGGSLVDIYDGAGNLTSLRMGQRSAGVACYSLSASALSASNIIYPQTIGANGSVLSQTTTVNGTAQTALTSIESIICRSGGVSFTPDNGYSTDAIETAVDSHITRPLVSCGVVKGLKSRVISDVTAADGGITRAAQASTSFISNMTLKGGLVTAVTFGLSSSNSGSVLAKGYVCFNGNTGAVISSSNLTVSRTGIGVYAVTLDSSIRSSGSTYAAMVGAIDAGGFVSASFADGAMDVRTVGIDTYTPSGFIVRAKKRYNVDAIQVAGDDINTLHRWAGIATDAGRLTVVVF
jgi:hypothetical protein